MKNSREEKGITLVALIITIVVLLILAGVAIGTVRDSDIIGHAKNASNSYEQARNNEISEIQSAEDLLEQYASQKNPWQQKGLTAPIEYNKEYSGEITTDETLPVSIKLGTDGSCIVKVSGVDPKGEVTEVTENSILYVVNGSDEIEIVFNPNGLEAAVFIGNTPVGNLTVSNETTTQRRIEYYMPESSMGDTNAGIFAIDYDNSLMTMFVASGSVTEWRTVQISEVESDIQVTVDDETITIIAGAVSVLGSEGKTVPDFYIQDRKLYPPDNGGSWALPNDMVLITDETFIAQLDSIVNN